MRRARNGAFHPKEKHMKTQIDPNDAGDLAPGEPDAAFDAWTLDELDDLAGLGSVRVAFAGSDDTAS
jgi:hypothetical protein